MIAYLLEDIINTIGIGDSCIKKKIKEAKDLIQLDKNNEKIYYINAISMYIDAINESVKELYGLLNANYVKEDDISYDDVRLLQFEIDEIHRLFFLDKLHDKEDKEKDTPEKIKLREETDQYVSQKLERTFFEIKKYTDNLNLNLGVVFNSGNDKITDYKSVLKKVKDDKKDYKKFENLLAGNFWLDSFNKEENITWESFIEKFKDLMYVAEKEILTENQISNIRENLIPNRVMMVNYLDWDTFYEKTWINFSEKYKLLDNKEKKEYPKNIVEKAGNLKLKYRFYYLDDNEKKAQEKICTPIEIQIFPNKFSYKKKEKKEDLEEKEVSISKDLLNYGIIVGREKPGIYVPHVPFSYDDRTVSNKQFQISLVKEENSESYNYYINDISASNETKIRVTRKRFILEKGLMIEINSKVFLIESIYPNPSNSDEREIKNQGFEYLKWSKTNENMKKIVEKKSLNTNIEITLSYDEKGEISIAKNIPYTFGLADKCDFHKFDDENDDEETVPIKNKYSCKINFDNKLKLWYIEEEKNIADKDLPSVFILLKNYYENSENYAGLRGVQLKQDMSFGFLHHEYTVVELKN